MAPPQAADMPVAEVDVDERLVRRLRDAVGGVDDDMWRRAEGWSLVMAVAYLANSADNPLIASLGRRTVVALGLAAGS